MEVFRDGSTETPATKPLTPTENLSFVAETVTPDLARTLLARRRSGSERQPEVGRGYAVVMRDGGWILNGSPIVVSRTGVLLDGVQRLLACVEADVSFPSFIARGVGDDVAHTIDQHRKRALAGILGAGGVPHARALTALVTQLLAYDDLLRDPADTQPPQWDRAARAMRANPGLESAVTASLRLAGSPLPEPVRTAILYMGHQVNAAQTDRLLLAVAHPETVSPGEPGAVLRAELDRAAETGAGGLGRTAIFALAIKALNAQITGTSLSRIRWVEHAAGGVPAEAFPRLIGYEGLVIPPSAGMSDAMADRVDVSFEVIDAATARRYLAMNIAERGFIKTHVAALARDIAAGRWMSNAQPICFSAGGRLMNGQHRMLAVIAARGTIQAPVIRGLPEAAFATYDTHARRAPAVEDAAGAFGDQALAAAMANLLWMQERRGSTTRGKKATSAEVRQILAAFPELLAMRGFARRMLAYGHASVMGYGAFAIERDHPTHGAAFLKALETGADLPEGHPVLALREELRSLRQRRAPPEAQLAALLGGWERYRARLESSTATDAVTPVVSAPRRPVAAPAFPSTGAAAPAEVTDAQAAMHRYRRQQAMLARFGALALRGVPAAALLQEAARLAAEGLDTRQARVLAHDHATGTLLMRAGVGWREGAVGVLRVPAGPGSPAGEAFVSRRPVVLNDGPAERRQANVVIGGFDMPFGVLGVEGAGARVYGESDVNFLQALANTLALALASRRG